MTCREISQCSRLKKDTSETPKKIKRADVKHRTNLLSTIMIMNSSGFEAASGLCAFFGACLIQQCRDQMVNHPL